MTFLRSAFTVVRAITRAPIAAWIATSYIWRGMNSFSLRDQLGAARVRLVAVHDQRERVDRVAVHQHVELHEVRGR